jgi:hypothetical protein
VRRCVLDAQRAFDLGVINRVVDPSSIQYCIAVPVGPVQYPVLRAAGYDFDYWILVASHERRPIKVKSKVALRFVGA